MSKTVTPVTVALVNDYELVLAGVATLLRPYRDHLVVLDRAVERTPDRAVDVSLFDTYGAADDQLDRVKTLAEDRTSGAVVVFSFSTAPRLVTAALGAGAGGFVSKTVNGRQLADAIVKVADGHRVVLTPTPHRHRDGALGWPGRGRDLSARDSELLVLLRQGYTNREIAERLYLSENTVKTHLRRLFHKLGVSNRTQAAMVATEDEEFRPRTATPTPAAAAAAAAV
jgi:DNA-binding NarL/FixJ family response regulator